MGGSSVDSVRSGLWFLLAVVLPFSGCGLTAKRAVPPPLEVSITTHLGDAQTFRDGDPLSFFISLSSDAHVLLLYEDASGAVSQLVPNAKFHSTFVAAGDFISMPPPEAEFTLRVSAPFGAETAWLIASEKPLPGLPNRLAADGVARIQGDLASIRRNLQQHASRSQVRYGEASVSITTTSQ